ncbi:MAG: hypothetical protein JSS76_18415 [Bacteroidetes bacterium]|nr:hypothetical protein [Bacteroidota bacterium]MBS1686720.1 hypothetical protein [Bacteroidota bacterium]
MKYYILASLLALSTLADAKGDKVKYKDQSADMGDASIRIVDAVATDAYTKFKIRVANKGSETMVLKAQDIVFVVNGKEYKPASEKPLTIGPGGEESRVVNVEGPGLATDKYSVRIGSLYKVKTDGGALHVPDFKLPASSNDFTAGGFKCTLAKQVRKTDVTEIVFDCYYSGSKLGLVDPGKISLKMPNGKTYANGHRSRPLTLDKGQKDDFKLVWKNIPVSDGDMQFAEMYIQFGDAFADAHLEPVAAQTIEMVKE